MGVSFIPLREADLITWALNFGQKAASEAAAVGLTTAQATAFENLTGDFQDAYATANDPATRSPMNIELKNNAKKKLIASARQLAGIVQKFPGTTDALRISFLLTVRAKPQPAPVPDASPFMKVKSVNGRTVTLELCQDKTKRGRPAKVTGASVFTAAAGATTDDLSAWNFYANTNDTTVDVTFPPSSVGDTVQITAFWRNSRSESGPAAQPVTVNLPASGNLPSGTKLKMAA